MDRAAREVAVTGTFKHDFAVFFPRRFRRKNRLYRENFFLEQMADRRFSLEMLAVVDEDGIGPLCLAHQCRNHMNSLRRWVSIDVLL